MDTGTKLKTAYQGGRVMGNRQRRGRGGWACNTHLIRHVDARERRLAVKLFQRHARGTRRPRRAKTCCVWAAATDDPVQPVASRIKGAGRRCPASWLSTSADELVELDERRCWSRFQKKNPDVTVRFLTGGVFRLEYAVKPISRIRARQVPEQPDKCGYSRFHMLQMGLFRP